MTDLDPFSHMLQDIKNSVYILISTRYTTLRPTIIYITVFLFFLVVTNFKRNLLTKHFLSILTKSNH